MACNIYEQVWSLCSAQQSSSSFSLIGGNVNACLRKGALRVS